MAAFNTTGGYVNDYGTFPGYDIPQTPGILPSGALAFKGFNAGMSPLMTRTVAATQASIARIRISCQKSFRRFRLVYPVFYQTSTGPFTDTLFSGNLDGCRIKAAFEYPYTMSNTGIPAGRPVVTFDRGATSRVYTAANHDTATGYFISDIFDIGFFLPPNANFGIWTAYETPTNTADRLSGGALIDTRLEQRFCGAQLSTVPVTTEGGAGTDWCVDQTSINLITGSGTSCVGPAAILIETSAGTEVVGINGDSIAFGTGEGDTEQGTTDFSGTKAMRKGYLARGLSNNYPDVFYVDVARGTDRAEYQGLNDTNSQYRHELLRIGGCTKLVNNMLTNDTGNTNVPSAFATSTAYTVAATIIANSNIYMCIKAGTSLGSGTGPSGTSNRIENGTAQFAWLTADTSTTSQRMMWSWAFLCNMNRLMKLRCGGIRLWQICMLPKSTLATNGGAFAPTDQTPNGFLAPLNLLNLRMRALTLGDNEASIDALLDFSSFLEYGYNDNPASPTGKWKMDGVANNYSQDGLHPNSHGHTFIASNLLFT